MRITLPSFAKLNWRLEVLGRRADGYHEVRTILQTISITDTLTLEETEKGIDLSCEAPGVPVDGTNLIARAAAHFLAETGVGKGVRIHLEKRIPVAAGLGGGSSNAAVTLLGLERLWSTGLARERMLALAASLGADVPYFLGGGTALGKGRGDEIEELPEVGCSRILLINPGIAISAAEAYRALPARLTLPYVKDKMPFSLEKAGLGAFAPMRVPAGLKPEGLKPEGLQNDLEPGVLALYPALEEIRSRMRRAGALAILMSGSGSTFFALFETDAARAAAKKDIEDTGWWSAPVETVSRRQYHDALGLNV
jgi:4-diphosphocytidyl-2-C-methyl-D-erythritol kinase